METSCLRMMIQIILMIKSLSRWGVNGSHSSLVLQKKKEDKIGALFGGVWILVTSVTNIQTISNIQQQLVMGG